ILRRPPSFTPLYSSAASDVYKRQVGAGAFIKMTVARMERSAIRGGLPAFRGACHRAALCADPLAHVSYGTSTNSLVCGAAPDVGLDRKLGAAAEAGAID